MEIIVSNPDGRGWQTYILTDTPEYDFVKEAGGKVLEIDGKTYTPVLTAYDLGPVLVAQRRWRWQAVRSGRKILRQEERRRKKIRAASYACTKRTPTETVGVLFVQQEMKRERIRKTNRNGGGELLSGQAAPAENGPELLAA